MFVHSRSRPAIRALIALVLATFAPIALADDVVVLMAKVVGVHDGDTVTMLDDSKTQHKIRLEGIDAPELGQPFGSKSKLALSEKVFGKEVRIKSFGNDKYGRMLGHLYIGDRWINQEMLTDGMAWHFKKYSADETLAAAELKARERKAGLWSDPKAEAPWEFRHPAVNNAATDAEGNALVYVTKTGKKYHRSNCPQVGRKGIQLPLKEAVVRFQPCKMCNPPIGEIQK